MDTRLPERDRDDGQKQGDAGTTDHSTEETEAMRLDRTDAIIRVAFARLLWKIVLVMIALATVGPCVWGKP